MDYVEVEGSREFVARLEHGADWRGQIEAFAEDEGLDAGFFFGLGAVKDAHLAYYDQTEKSYGAIAFDEPLEVAPAVGNISLLDGDPFAHTHVTLSREDGSTVAGHLDAATTFAGEVWIRELDADLVRAFDPVTELDLWEI